MSGTAELAQFVSVVDRPDEYHKVEIQLLLPLRILTVKTRHPFVDSLEISLLEM
jgi:hypothetical protein